MLSTSEFWEGGGASVEARGLTSGGAGGVKVCPPMGGLFETDNPPLFGGLAMATSEEAVLAEGVFRRLMFERMERPGGMFL